MMVNSLRQTVHNHLVSAQQAAKLLATLLRLARVTAGLVESNDGAVHHDSGHRIIAADISIRWPIVISKNNAKYC